MSNKPIFVATHPRACSTAFERVKNYPSSLGAPKLTIPQVFMTRRDSLQCVHEPFGDAFYYGPERLSSRYENDEKQRVDIGFSESTYQTILDRFERESAEVRIIPSPESHFLVRMAFTNSFLYCSEYLLYLRNSPLFYNSRSPMPASTAFAHPGLTNPSTKFAATFL